MSDYDPDELTAEGVPTALGHDVWHAAQVSRVLITVSLDAEAEVRRNGAREGVTSSSTLEGERMSEKWEYLRTGAGTDWQARPNDLNRISPRLNELGQAGWELVAYIPRSAAGSGVFGKSPRQHEGDLLLKRRLP